MKLYTQICPAAFARRANCSTRRDLYSWSYSLCHVIKWQKYLLSPGERIVPPGDSFFFRPANERRPKAETLQLFFSLARRAKCSAGRITPVCTFYFFKCFFLY